MFGVRYFAPRYFAPRYWPPTPADVVDTSIADLEYAYSIAGSFTPIAGTSAIKYESINWRTNNRLYDATGFQGTTPDKSRNYDFGVPVEDMQGRGWAYTTRYGSSQQASITLGTVNMVPLRWTVRKSWRLTPASGHGPLGKDCSLSNWGYDTPTYDIACEGLVLQSDGPKVRSQRVSVSITSEGFGTMSWDNDIHVSHFTIGNRLTKGTKVKCSFSGKVEGSVSYSDVPSDGNDFSWLFVGAGVADPPVSGLFTLDTNAETITNNALMYDVTLRFLASTAHKVQIDTRMRVNA